MTALIETIAVLKRIKALGELEYNSSVAPFDFYFNPHEGICDNFTVLAGFTCNSPVAKLREIQLAYMARARQGWVHFSGRDAYPIKSPWVIFEDDIELTDYSAAKSVYWGSSNKWKGEYGQRRLELLDRLIAEIQANIDKGRIV